jgi:hypothetical protein
MAPSSENGGGGSSTNGSGHSVIDLAARLTVSRSPKAFSSYAKSLISLPAGAVFAPLTGITSGTKAYSTVQTGRDEHIELNSDLLYCNHSCTPSLEFDMARLEVRVARGRPLHVGDGLTFWYPSTEWDMAQPFECHCGTSACKGWIAGAGQMDESVVREYWLNEHIEGLLRERGDRTAGKNGHVNGLNTTNGVKIESV